MKYNGECNKGKCSYSTINICCIECNSRSICDNKCNTSGKLNICTKCRDFIAKDKYDLK